MTTPGKVFTVESTVERYASFPIPNGRQGDKKKEGSKEGEEEEEAREDSKEGKLNILEPAKARVQIVPISR